MKAKEVADEVHATVEALCNGDAIGANPTRLIKEYAKEKCDEQRKLIAKHFMAGKCYAPDCALKAMKNAPDPNFE